MKKFANEFREFAMRGNVIDLAVGVVIGAAFGKIVTSIVEDLIMPIIGRIVGNIDFSNLYFPLSDKIPTGTSLTDAKNLGPVIAYGNFITILINFLIIAFCIFLVVKMINRAMPKKKTEPAPQGPSETELLTDIRDILKKQKSEK